MNLPENCCSDKHFCSRDKIGVTNSSSYTPILEDIEPGGFTVSTSSFPKIGNVMYQVIQACDRAQLVLANLTGNNPNVLYEMAVLDAMGRACVPLKIGDDAYIEKDKVPFDRAAYRAFVIPRETKAAAVAALSVHRKGNLGAEPRAEVMPDALRAVTARSTQGLMG